jgi:YD repeat-containing protein
MHDPDMGDWSYSYDALGNLLTQTDAKAQVIGFAYDGLNRLVEKDYGDDGSVEARYFYDGDTCTGCTTPTGKREGRQTAVWTAGSWAVYHYDDARGRLSSEERAIDGAPGGPFETEYTYDAMDRPVTMTMPDTEVITTTYNVAGLPVTLVGDTPYVTGTGYNALDQVTQGVVAGPASPLDLANPAGSMIRRERWACVAAILRIPGLVPTHISPRPPRSCSIGYQTWTCHDGPVSETR